MLQRYTKEGGESEMAGTWSTGVGNEVERTGRKEGEGNLGKHTGNKSGETRGGPVPIEKQNGDNSHRGNREGRRRSDSPGGYYPSVQKNGEGTPVVPESSTREILV